MVRASFLVVDEVMKKALIVSKRASSRQR